MSDHADQAQSAQSVGNDSRHPRGWIPLTDPRARTFGVLVLCGVNSAVFGYSELANLPDPQVLASGWQTPVVLSLSALFVSPFLLLWRRRAPVLITVLTAVAYLLSSVLLPVGFALLTVAVQRRGWVLWACTAGVAATLWLSFDSSDPWYVRVGLSVVLASFWSLWGSYIGARRALLHSLRDRARRAETEQLARADQARQHERARIAREMHDIVAHKVSLIALQAGGLEVNPQLEHDRVTGAAAQIRMAAREALEDLRGVLGVLRDDRLEGGSGAELLPQPGLPELRTLIDRSRTSGLSVALVMSVEADGAQVASSTGRTVYRVVEEALTNVAKHARGAATTVTVARRPAGLDTPDIGSAHVLEVAIANRRPVAAGSLLPGSGAGLVGLRERVELIGGRLSAGPTAEGGWRVDVLLPVTGADGTMTAGSREG